VADDPAQASANQYANGVAQLRTTARWLIGAFGALGAALIAGVQLKNLAGVSSTPLEEAIASISVGVFGVAIAIWSTSNVLIPIAASSRALEHTGEFDPLRKAARTDPSMLRGLASNLGALVAALSTSLTTSQNAYHKMAAAPNDPGLRDAYAKAEVERQQIESAVSELTAFGLFLAVRKRFVVARRMMFLGAALATAGAIGFVHFAQTTTPPPAPKKPAPAHIVTLTVVPVRLTADGTHALRHKLGPHCRLGRLTAVVTGGPTGSPTIVTLPRSGCRAISLTLTRNIGGVHL